MLNDALNAALLGQFTPPKQGTQSLLRRTKKVSLSYRYALIAQPSMHLLNWLNHGIYVTLFAV